MADEQQPTTTEQEWESLRDTFQDSIMVDTKLTSLAQNVGTRDWPLKAEDETPAKYIFYSWEELMLMPEIQKDARRVDLLVEILRETAAFDDPFGDMVDQFDTASEEEDSVRKNLEKHEIPESFPLELSNLSADTLSFCQAEDINTLGEFAKFSQNMAQNIVIGGDFRDLLNSLTHFDAEAIARFLPFRPHHKGLHVPEAVAFFVRAYNDSTRKALLKRAGGEVSGEDAKKIKRFSKEELNEIEAKVQAHARRVFEALPDSKADLQKDLAEGKQIERLVVPLNDPEIEPIVARNLFLALQKDAPVTPVEPSGTDTPPQMEEQKRKRGLFGRIFGRE